MNDMLEEELQIMEEQLLENPKVLNEEIFKLPIEKLNVSKCFSVDESANIYETVESMQKKKIGSVVITKNGKLTGIITERDILMKVVGKISDLKNTKVKEVMTADPIALRSEDMIAYVMNNMHVGGYRHVPIVNENEEPVGMISIKDVMSFILDYFPESILNITGEPFRGPVSRESA